jgi:hypothetical protein
MAAQHGQGHVKDHQVRLELLRHRNGLPSIFDSDHGESLILERATDEVQDRRIIINHEHAGGLGVVT